jgi:phosphoribosylamine--glycine ligase
MRFNFVSEAGDGFGFAYRLVLEGHEVRMWIRDKEGKAIGTNMVEKVGDVEDLIDDATPDNDIFIFDTVGNGIIANYLKDQDFAVLGGSVLADRLERERSYGYNVMEKCDIEIPATQSFTDFDKAIDFVNSHPETKWVYKPSKFLGEEAPSRVTEDAEDLIFMLENIRDKITVDKPEFELQSFEEGVALSTELWFQNGDFVEPLTNHTLERKELMNEDIGPTGGCVGNLTWFCEGCKVCRVVKQLVPWCAARGYHGMLDLNAIVARRRIYGLEFTPRFGYDAAPTLLFELVRGGLGTFFETFARGQVGGLDLRDGFAGAVGVTMSPWPAEKFMAEEDVPIRGLDETEVYWYNVKKDDGNNLVTAGAWGNIGCVTHHSADPSVAMAGPLRQLRELKLKNKQFRTDLHKVFVKDLEKLAEFDVSVANYASE